MPLTVICGPTSRLLSLRSGSTTCCNSKLERIVSIGHVTPPGEWYDQNEGEWVVLLQGQARLRFADDDRERVLNSGDYLWIAAHRRHRVEWTSQRPPAIWLAFHFGKVADGS